jgi:transcriptional regulator with XRE-family HTH domain
MHLEAHFQSFGARVRYFRHIRGLSQEELSKVTGLERKTISRLETGAGSTSLRTVYTVADALQVEPLELFVEEK